MAIVPLERQRLSDAAVSQLLTLIRTGVFAVGAKLPSERELAKDLGVSRVLVRESLRAIEALGLIEVKPGIGAFVARQSPLAVPIAHYLRSHPTEVLEVVEVREGLAGLAGELAARRLTDAECAELEQLVAAQWEAHAGGRAADLPELDERFHMIIYRATRNHVLTTVHDYTRSVLDNIRWNSITLMVRTEDSLHEHERIIEALKARDPRAASAALRSHARRSLADIRRFVEQFSTSAADNPAGPQPHGDRDPPPPR